MSFNCDTCYKIANTEYHTLRIPIFLSWSHLCSGDRGIFQFTSSSLLENTPAKSRVGVRGKSCLTRVKGPFVPLYDLSKKWLHSLAQNKFKFNVKDLNKTKQKPQNIQEKKMRDSFLILKYDLYKHDLKHKTHKSKLSLTS